MSTAGRLAFASAHGMIDRVHGDSTRVRPFAYPPGTSRFAEFYTFVVDVADLPNGGATANVN
jgi:hypothetical protein